MLHPSGILLVDKPVGPTSHDIVHRVRCLLAPGARGADRVRVGHAGTLDPLASGLLVVLVGRGTRLAPFLSGLDKSYVAEVRFGVATASLDREGEVVATAAVPPQPDGLPAALAALTGEIAQIPPVYSAIKLGGRPLHRLARAGTPVAAPAARRIVIHALAVTDLAWGVAPGDPADELPPAPDGRVYAARLRVDCSSGTYVRSLARDLAALLGTVGHLHALQRTRVGPFPLSGARTLAEWELDPRAAAAAVIPLAAALPHLPRHVLAAEQAAELRRSGRIETGWLPAAIAAAAVACLVDPAGKLVAISRAGDTVGAVVAAAVFPIAADDEDPSCA